MVMDHQKHQRAPIEFFNDVNDEFPSKAEDESDITNSSKSTPVSSKQSDAKNSQIIDQPMTDESSSQDKIVKKGKGSVKASSCKSKSDKNPKIKLQL